MNKQHKERGGIVSFAVITMVLVALLGGGLYLSKQYARSARDAGAPVVTQTEKSTPVEKTDTTPKTTSQTATPKKETPKPQVTPVPSNSHTQQQSPVAATGPSSVAATGPSDVALIVATSALLSFTFYMAIDSRRNVRRAALEL